MVVDKEWITEREEKGEGEGEDAFKINDYFLFFSTYNEFSFSITITSSS